MPSRRINNLQRFWCRSEGNYHRADSGYLLDPAATPNSGFLQSDVVSLDEVSDMPCLALLGEPGSGKSMVMTARGDASRRCCPIARWAPRGAVAAGPGGEATASRGAVCANAFGGGPDGAGASHRGAAARLDDSDEMLDEVGFSRSENDDETAHPPGATSLDLKPVAEFRANSVLYAPGAQSQVAGLLRREVR